MYRNNFAEKSGVVKNYLKLGRTELQFVDWKEQLTVWINFGQT